MSVLQTFIGGFKLAQIIAAATDPYFTNVVLLLHLNSSLNDSSQKASAVTSSGTTPTFITSAGPGAKVGTGALQLVSGTRLLVPATNLSFTGDFTIECWTYTSDVNTPTVVLDTYGSASSGYQLFTYNGSAQFYYNGNNTVNLGNVLSNTWNHYAVSRVGSTLRAFVNGVLGATVTVSGTIAAAQTNMALNYQQAGTNDFSIGYLDEVRITNGVGRYTANFTPSTTQSLAYLTSGVLTWAIPNASPLQVATKTYPNASSYVAGVTLDDQNAWRMPTVAETQALVAQYGAAYLRSVGWPTASPSWGWIGEALNGANQYVHGMGPTEQGVGTPLGFSNGNNSTDSFPVYYAVNAGGDPYFSSVVLLLHMDGSLVDKSSKASTIASSGTAVTYQTTASTPPAKVGTGAVALVSGTRLTTPATNLTFLGDFTEEFWYYPTSISNTSLLDTYYSSGKPGTGTGTQFTIFNGRLDFYYNGYNVISSSGTGNSGSGLSLATGSWYHLAVSRVGTTLRLFLNGTIVATGTVSGTITATVAGDANSQSNLALNYQQTSGPTAIGLGYMDEVRITNGVGRYTANFTPTTTSFPDYGA